MGGSSKRQTVGYKYLLGMHNVLCHGPIDEVIEVMVDDKVVPHVPAYDVNGAQYHEDLNLFGGESREGGVAVNIWIEKGEPDQQPNSYLQSMLGNTIPAFRGVVSAIIRGYMGNNPYLKPWSFKAQRIHVTGRDGAEQWYDEKAAIGLFGDEPIAIHLALDFSGSMDTVTGNGNTRFENQIAAVISTLQTIDNASYAGRLDIQIEGFTNGGSIARYNVDSGDIQDLIDWLNAASSGGGTYWPNGVDSAPTFFATAPSNSTRLLFLLTDGAPAESGYTASEIITNTNAILSSISGLSIYGINIDLEDTSYTEQIDNTPADGVPVVEGDDASAIRAAVLESFYNHYDMNPAHIIRETITDAVWGMAYQSADIDDTFFTDAADTLFDEGMGISMLWDRSSDIEAFQQEILRHINGVLRMDHTTGKFQLKLIRDDYDVESLITLDGSNVSKVEDLSRPAFSELVNTVTVKYWDAATNETASITVDNPALVLQQGFVNSADMDYPGFTNATIASRAGLRDLQAQSSPLVACTLYCDRSAASLNIGDAFILNLPDEGINNLVMRVSMGSFGDGKSHAIKLDAVQDVFGLPAAGVVNEGDEAWENPASDPVAADYHLVLEAPYYEMVQRLGQTAVDTLLVDSPDMGYLLAAAARPTGAINADLVVDAGAGYNTSDSVGLDFCGSATLLVSVDYLDTEIALENGLDLDDVEVGSIAQINNELVRVDAIDADAETCTLGRGVLDTVPAQHAAGDRIFFWGDYAESDSVEYADGEVLGVKILPATGRGLLDISDAPEDSLTLDQRAIRPYPPGQVKIGGDYYPEFIDTPSDLVVTWVHRDRLQQTSGTLYDFTDGSIGPEANTVYNGRLYNNDTDELLLVEYGIESPWSPSIAGSFELRLEVESERDSILSWQPYTHIFDYAAGGRALEDDDTRVTEGGELRALENESADDLAAGGLTAWAVYPFLYDGSDIVFSGRYRNEEYGFDYYRASTSSDGGATQYLSDEGMLNVTGAGGALAYGGGKYVAQNGTTYVGYADSIDGAWTNQSITSFSTIPQSGGIYFNDLIYDGSQFVRVGEYGLIMTSSGDGSWTEVENSLLGDGEFEKITHTGSKYLAIFRAGENGKWPGEDDEIQIVGSTDLENWVVEHTQGIGEQWHDIRYENSALFILGTKDVSGTYVAMVLQSTDAGSTWVDKSPTGLSPPSLSEAYDIAYFDSKYVIVGRAILAYSSDLSSWTVIDETDTYYFNLVSDGTYLVTMQFTAPISADAYVIQKTTDGINWSDA